MKKEKAPNMPLQWLKFIVVLVLYLLFLYWVKSWWGLIVVPFIFDVYITKKIKWQWWKEAEGPVRFIMSWVDALVFALVAVYFINLFFFQNYVIPSSSLEKSLLTGDYLFVSKVSYGPRIPETPLTLPLTQHTLPMFECKSYIEWPHWDYRRVKGLGKVELNDIVVFNYPAGDSVMSNPQYQANDYYKACFSAGLDMYKNQYGGLPVMDSLPQEKRDEFYRVIINAGRDAIKNNPQEYGKIIRRPTDRRENYVKRCVGLPGQTLQIKDHIVYLDGKPNKEPDNVQYTYFVKLNNVTLTKLLGEEYEPMRKELGISEEDLQSLSRLHGYDVDNNLILNDNVKQYDGYMPLTHKAAEELKKRGVAKAVVPVKDTDIYGGMVYPLNGFTGWTRDNYGPIWIPKKGQTIRLTLENLPIYERCIRVYEGNDLQTKGRQIFINGQKADRYTFKLDYYWMQGDNRHNSADSRYWGFVPEDHIVGKPLFIWWSSDPDRNGLSGVRWNRLFRWVDNIK